MSRKNLPPEVGTEVLVLCRRRCCICSGLAHDLSIKSGQIAHLDGRPRNNDLDNLAFLCLEHHDQYDTRTSQSKGLTPREVRRFRKELHEIIREVWKQPASVGGAEVRALDDISGRYVRETEYETAELDVKTLPGGLVSVTGIALWGTKREYGPNIGQLDFRAPVADRRVEFLDLTPGGDEYRLEIRFENGRAIAKEQYVVGYFGMNVSFEGEYRRIEESITPVHTFERILLRVLPQIAQLTGVRIDEIGLHVWLCQPLGATGPTSALARVARVRLSDATPSRPRPWRRGEGVVGQCWEKQTDVAIDLTDARYRVATDEEWQKLPPETTLGLSLREFLETTRHFKAICTTPIVPGYEAVGCVSLNFDRECEADFQRLWSNDIKSLLRRAAADVALLLRSR